MSPRLACVQAVITVNYVLLRSPPPAYSLGGSYDGYNYSDYGQKQERDDRYRHDPYAGSSRGDSRVGYRSEYSAPLPSEGGETTEQKILIPSNYAGRHVCTLV